MKNPADKIRILITEAVILSSACRDPRVPWLARAAVLAAIAYAFSPIDLIPDFIPLLGHLDDIIILPALIFFARKMIPDHIYEEYRSAAQLTPPRSIAAAVVVIAVWCAGIFLVISLFTHFCSHSGKA